MTSTHSQSSTKLRLRGSPYAPARALGLIIASGLVVRLALVAATTGVGLQIVDEQQYARLATHLVEGLGFAWKAGELTSLRPPLYPSFVAALWSVTGVGNLTAVRLAQIPFSLLTVWVVYALGRRLFSSRAALIAAGAAAFYPSLVFSGVLVLSETLFTLLFTVTLLGCVMLLEKPTLPVAFGTGVALAAAALTRSVMWPFIGIAVIGALLLVRGTWRVRAGVAVCLIAGYGLIVGPWAVRNTRLQHTVVIVDTMGGLNLLMGNYEHTPEDRMWDAISVPGEKNWAWNMGTSAPDGNAWTEGRKEQWAKARAVAYMKAHPGTTARRTVLKFADFWGIERDFLAGVSEGLYTPPGWVAGLAGVVTAGCYVLMMVLAVMGMTLAAPHRREHIVLLTVIAFVCAVHSIVFGHPRYHLPLVPILLLYAAAAVEARAWQRLRMTVPAARLAVAGVVLLCAIWSHEVFGRDAARISGVARTLGVLW